MSDDRSLSRAHRAVRRFSDRFMARNRHRLDEAEGLLTRQLDYWNRKLAERAIPRARRERVEAMARQRARGAARLSVVSGRSSGDDDGLS